jgi:hypothetical protein
MNALAQKTAYLLLLLLTVGLTACKKDKSDPEPDLASKVSGKYTFSELKYGGQTIPASETTIKGTITLRRDETDAVHVTLDIRRKTTNEEFMTGQFSDVVVATGENGELDLYYEAEERVAYVKGNKIFLFGVDEEEEEFTLVAVK